MERLGLDSVDILFCHDIDVWTHGDKQSEIFNLAYRYRRNMLKQLDASFSWPIRDHWNVVGRYNYSILDRKVLEQFVGIEYESCCWGIRVISRKHLAYRNGAIWGDVSEIHIITGIMAVLMTFVVMGGMLVRSRGRLMRVWTLDGFSITLIYLVSSVLIFRLG